MALLMLIGFVALIALPSVLWLYALADVAVNRFREITTKVVWLLVLCFFPPFGTILYFLIGRSQRRTHYPVGRVFLIAIMIIPILMTVAYFFYSLGHITFVPEPPKQMQIQI